MGYGEPELIQSSNVIFNEESMLFKASQPKIGQKVTFDLSEKESDDDEPIIQFKLTIRRNNEADLTKGPIVDPESNKRLARAQLAKMTIGRSEPVKEPTVEYKCIMAVFTLSLG